MAFLDMVENLSKNSFGKTGFLPAVVAILVSVDFWKTISFSTLQLN